MPGDSARSRQLAAARRTSWRPDAIVTTRIPPMARLSLQVLVQLARRTVEHALKWKHTAEHAPPIPDGAEADELTAALAPLDVRLLQQLGFRASDDELAQTSAWPLPWGCRRMSWRCPARTAACSTSGRRAATSSVVHLSSAGRRGWRQTASRLNSKQLRLQKRGLALRARPLLIIRDPSSSALTKPAYMTLHTPLGILELRPAIRARPHERLATVVRLILTLRLRTTLPRAPHDDRL